MQIGVISVEEAEQEINHQLVPFPSESIQIEAANGRVLAESLRADRDLPPFNRSTFDGIALSFEAIEKGLRSFPIEGIAFAGEPKRSISEPTSCVEIMTGAPLPDNADCVVKIEDLEISGKVAILKEQVPLSRGHGVHSQASDSPMGRTLLDAGVRLSAKELSIAASIGKSTLQVSQCPRISIVTTGDELVPVSATPEIHQIRRSNDLALEIALNSSGYADTRRYHLLDDPDETERAISSILTDSEVIILAGGVSKGKRDFLPDALAAAGVEKLFQWVSQRPGKPMWFGVAKHQEKTRFVFALPGNPVSCFTCLHRYTIPALDSMSGLAPSKTHHAKLKEDFEFKPPLTLFLPVALECDKLGQNWACPLPFNTSGDYVSVARTDGFIELPSNQSSFRKGASFRLHFWRV